MRRLVLEGLQAHWYPTWKKYKKQQQQQQQKHQNIRLSTYQAHGYYYYNNDSKQGNWL